jgi:hypothetical protein
MPEAKRRADKLLSDCMVSNQPVDELVAEAMREVQRATARSCLQMIEEALNDDLAEGSLENAVLRIRKRFGI